jgi:hypothetical protein
VVNDELALTEKQIEELADEALSAAVIYIQKKLDVPEKDGADFASLWWDDGDDRPHVETAFTNYIRAELAQLA